LSDQSALHYSYEVSSEEAGERLDLVLAARIGISRAQAKRWIEAARVNRNDKPGRASDRVQLSDRITATAPAVLPTELRPEAIPLDVLHEDEDLIVLNKPAGLVVHPAPGHTTGTLVHALLHHCSDLSGIGGVERPGIVHRLDRGTSGVMVVAKNDPAHLHLSGLFHDHEIERVYAALVRVLPGDDSGRIEAAIGRHPRDRKRMSTRTRGGRPAATRWRVVERFAGARAAWLEVSPETGRTHQIRVHLSSAGLPIAGDPVYGAGRGQRGKPWAGLGRPALHAAVLGFRHPRDGRVLRFETKPPEDLSRVLDACRLADGEGSSPAG